MFTEEQARTKACPLAGKFGASQQFADGPNPHCIASDCMAWRDGGVKWGPVLERIPALPGSTRPEGFTGYQLKKDGSPSEGGDWIRQETHHVGYCGLAGNPEAT